MKPTIGLKETKEMNKHKKTMYGLSGPSFFNDNGTTKTRESLSHAPFTALMVPGLSDTPALWNTKEEAERYRNVHHSGLRVTEVELVF